MTASYQDTGPTNTLNLLSSSAEEFDLHNDTLLWELSLPQNLVVAQLHHINERSLVFDSIYPCLLTDQNSCLLTDQGPQFQGGQWGKSSGSSLSGHASYQLSQSW